MTRISDKNRDGRIDLGELHYALRAWHSYRHLDDAVLRLFAEFDFDASGRLDAGELRELLTAINGGKPVPWEEVRHVLRQSDLLGTGAISRSELLGAIAAWFVHVDRQDTDIPTLMREAVTRTCKDNDQLELLSLGTRSLTRAASLVRGGLSGYAEVAEAQDPEDSRSGLQSPNLESAQTGADDDVGPKTVSARLTKAAPHVARSCTSFCYVAAPFLFGWCMATSGWQHRYNSCPRNLDGVLLWYGLLVLLLSGLLYVPDPSVVVERSRIAIAVMLVVLNLVGFLWVRDEDVQDNVGLCGRVLVYWSMFIWAAIPIAAVGYACFFLASHVRRLQRGDELLQRQIVL